CASRLSVWSGSFCYSGADPRHLPSFPTRRSSDLGGHPGGGLEVVVFPVDQIPVPGGQGIQRPLQGLNPLLLEQLLLRAGRSSCRSEEHTSELQSRFDLVCRLLLEKKNGRRP